MSATATPLVVGTAIGSAIIGKKKSDEAKKQAERSAKEIEKKKKERADQESRLAAIDKAEKMRSEKLASQRSRQGGGRSQSVLASKLGSADMLGGYRA